MKIDQNMLPQTVASFAREVGMTRQALYKHIARGNLRAKKAGHFTVIEPADALQFKGRLRPIRYGARTQQVVE